MLKRCSKPNCPRTATGDFCKRHIEKPVKPKIKKIKKKRKVHNGCKSCGELVHKTRFDQSICTFRLNNMATFSKDGVTFSKTLEEARIKYLRYAKRHP